MKILPFILLFILTGCFDKNAPGKNETFFCQINGKAFRPDKDDSPIGGVGSDPLRVSFDKENGYLSVIVRNSPNSISFYMNVAKNESLKIQNITLTSNPNNSKAYFTKDYAEINKEQLISESGTFKIEKIDGYNLSGTFEFTCKSAKTGKVYEITEGEFNNLSYF